MAAPEIRVVTVRPTTVLMVLGITALVGIVLLLGYWAWHVITWILIAMFLAAALNPAVEAFERRGMRRSLAASLVFFLALAILTAIGFLVIPPLVTQVRDFVEAVPDFIDDITAGRGPFGFLQEDYQLVDRIRDAIDRGGAAGALGLGGGVLDVVRSVVTAVVGAVTVVFLTFFMLLSGPRTLQRALDLLPPPTRSRYERVGREIYRTISGYVTGNLLISLIAGVSSAGVLFAVGSDYAIALGLLVAILDLIPLAGATLAAIFVTTIVVIETDWLRAVLVLAFFIGYQQLENHVLQPLVYGRTVQLSPLAVLCAVLIGAELAGILGALLAIPVAGSLIAVVREVLQYRREAAIETPPGADLAAEPE
jgi:predicted PurR-regulated permease PerM